MLKRIQAVLLLAMLTLIPAAAFAEEAWVYSLRSPAEDFAYKRNQRFLMQKLRWPMPKETLAQMAAKLRARGIPFLVDSRALDDVGIKDSVELIPVTAGLTLRAALKKRLEGHDLVVMNRDEVLQVTTPEEAYANLDTRLYDVTGLVPEHRMRTGAGLILYGRDFDTLMDLIVTTINPEDWDEVGGPGSISSITPGTRAFLVVSQYQEVHERVELLLAKLYRAGRVPEPTSFEAKAPASVISTIRKSNLRRSQIVRNR